jgi:hypothetical protein
MRMRDGPWELPNARRPTQWFLDLHHLPSTTPRLCELRAALQQLALDLTALTPDLVTDNEEDDEDEDETDAALQDTPADPPATIAGPLVAEGVENAESSQSKGKGKAVASPTPEAEIDEAMALVDAEMQKELAGHRILAEQNLIPQDPKVSRLRLPLSALLMALFQCQRCVLHNHICAVDPAAKSKGDSKRCESCRRVKAGCSLKAVKPSKAAGPVALKKPEMPMPKKKAKSSAIVDDDSDIEMLPAPAKPAKAIGGTKPAIPRPRSVSE